MKPGDVVTEEPLVGSILRDGDGDEYVRHGDAWVLTRDGTRTTWSFIARAYGPLTLIRFGPAPEPEWEPVKPEDVRAGDEIEIVQRYGTTTTSTCGVVTATDINATEGDGFVDLGEFRCVNIRNGELRRRVRPAMPEPGPGAVVEVPGHRFASMCTLTEHPWRWVDIWQPKLDENARPLTWQEVCALGQPVEKLPPAATS